MWITMNWGWTPTWEQLNHSSTSSMQPPMPNFYQLEVQLLMGACLRQYDPTEVLFVRSYYYLK